MTRLVTALLLWLAPAQACEPLDAGEKPRVERASDGRGVHISYRTRLLVPLAAIDQLLSMPSSFPQWLPGVSEATATADGFVAIYLLPWPLGRVREVIRVERRAHPDGGVSFDWRRISGDFKRDDTCWRLRSIDATTTEVIYSANLQLHRWVPMSLMRRAERRALPRAAANLENAAADMP